MTVMIDQTRNSHEEIARMMAAIGGGGGSAEPTRTSGGGGGYPDVCIPPELKKIASAPAADLLRELRLNGTWSRVAERFGVTAAIEIICLLRSQSDCGQDPTFRVRVPSASNILRILRIQTILQLHDDGLEIAEIEGRLRSISLFDALPLRDYTVHRTIKHHRGSKLRKKGSHIRPSQQQTTS